MKGLLLLLRRGRRIQRESKRGCAGARRLFFNQTDSCPKAYAFEPADDRHIALQVLSPDLQLAGIVLHVGKSAERGDVSGGADEQGVLGWLRANSASGGTVTRSVYGRSLKTTGVRRRFALKDGTCVELDFLRSKPGARRHSLIHPERNGRAADRVLNAVFHVFHAKDGFDGIADFRAQTFKRSRFSENNLISIGSGELVRSPIMSSRSWMKSVSSCGNCVLTCLPRLRDHFLHSAAPLLFQIYGDVAGICFCDGGEPELQAGTSRSALHFGNRIQDLLHPTSTRFVSVSEAPAGIR